MTWADFLVRYRETEAALNVYVSHLPLWVNVWRGWMFFIFTLAVVFVIPKREARWLALTMMVSIFAYNLVSMLSGVGRFPSIAFVLFWTARHLLRSPTGAASARAHIRPPVSLVVHCRADNAVHFAGIRQLQCRVFIRCRRTVRFDTDTLRRIRSPCSVCGAGIDRNGAR